LPLEQALEKSDASALLPDWPQRSRSAALLADLDELSLSVPRFSRFVNDERLREDAFQFGTLYVLEGSRLGGKLLLRQLQLSARSLPSRFLSHGQSQPLWQTFIAKLEASDAARENAGAVIDGATSAFAMFLNSDVEPKKL
jgi:heme oxygenase (biliverdin-IX-beta and delta-forming)